MATAALRWSLGWLAPIIVMSGGMPPALAIAIWLAPLPSDMDHSAPASWYVFFYEGEWEAYDAGMRNKYTRTQNAHTCTNCMAYPSQETRADVQRYSWGTLRAAALGQ